MLLTFITYINVNWMSIQYIDIEHRFLHIWHNNSFVLLFSFTLSLCLPLFFSNTFNSSDSIYTTISTTKIQCPAAAAAVFVADVVVGIVVGWSVVLLQISPVILYMYGYVCLWPLFNMFIYNISSLLILFTYCCSWCWLSSCSSSSSWSSSVGTGSSKNLQLATSDVYFYHNKHTGTLTKSGVWEGERERK